MGEYRFDRGRWAELSFNEQMGNIASEVGRAIAAHRNGKSDRETRAIDRAIDLFSATAEVLVGTKHAYRLKEVLRARDEFLRLFFDGTFDADADKIDRFRELDEAFHHDLEQIVLASRANDVERTAEAVGKALTACNGCHAEFRQTIAGGP